MLFVLTCVLRYWRAGHFWPILVFEFVIGITWRQSAIFEKEPAANLLSHLETAGKIDCSHGFFKALQNMQKILHSVFADRQTSFVLIGVMMSKKIWRLPERIMSRVLMWTSARASDGESHVVANASSYKTYDHMTQTQTQFHNPNAKDIAQYEENTLKGQKCTRHTNITQWWLLCYLKWLHEPHPQSKMHINVVNILTWWSKVNSWIKETLLHYCHFGPI